MWDFEILGLVARVAALVGGAIGPVFEPLEALLQAFAARGIEHETDLEAAIDALAGGGFHATHLIDISHEPGVARRHRRGGKDRTFKVEMGDLAGVLAHVGQHEAAKQNRARRVAALLVIVGGHWLGSEHQTSRSLVNRLLDPLPKAVAAVARGHGPKVAPVL